jgi:hypothetical protein
MPIIFHDTTSRVDSTLIDHGLLQGISDNDHTQYELLDNKDVDGLLTSNSDTKYCSQKAAKTYVDAEVSMASASAAAALAAANSVQTDVDIGEELTHGHFIDFAVLVDGESRCFTGRNATASLTLAVGEIVQIDAVTPANKWLKQKADAEPTIKGMSAIIIEGGDADETVKIMFQGILRKDSLTSVFALGDIVYISPTTAGAWSIIPSTVGHFVKPVGQIMYDDSNNKVIYFDPSKTYVEIIDLKYGIKLKN